MAGYTFATWATLMKRFLMLTEEKDDDGWYPQISFITHPHHRTSTSKSRDTQRLKSSTEYGLDTGCQILTRPSYQPQ